MRRRWWVWAIGVALLALAARFAWRFPWAETARVLVGASVALLAAAVVVNLLSLVAKATAWHLLLRHEGVPHWRSSLDATVIGAAVNTVGVAASGDAARVHVLLRRDAVGLGRAVASLVWSRVVEAVGLALMLVLGGALLPLPAWLRPAQAVLAAAIVVLVVLTATGGWAALARRVPARLGPLVARVAATAPRRHLPAILGLGLVNWLTQWATYHLSIAAVEGHLAPVASFVALLASNVGGLPKLTPGNVGVMQAAFVLGLTPFGIPIERAVAAGLVCQAVQVLPVLLAGIGLAGWGGLRATARAAVDDATLAAEAMSDAG